MKYFVLFSLLIISFSTYSQSSKDLLAYTEHSNNEFLLFDTISIPMNLNSNYSEYSYDNERKNKFGLIIFEAAEFFDNDFSDFEPIIGSYNIDNIKRSNAILITEIAGTYRNYYLGISCGFSSDDNNKHDSLNIEFNTTQFGLNFGYNIINTKRFLITPKVSFKWNRYRFINSDNEDKIPIEQYINDRDLDLRFHQLVGVIGLNLSVKFYENNLMFTDYWTVGLYGGYSFKMNNKPYVYSSHNRLTTDRRIHMKDYNIGLYISFNFANKYEN